MQDLYQNGLFQPEGDSLTRLPRKALTLWRIQTAIEGTVYTALAATALGLLMPWWQDWDPRWALATALVAAAFTWHWFRLTLRWEMNAYRLDDEEVHIRHGVLSRTLETFPYGRIQVVQVSSGFWARRLGLATVEVFFGGGAATSIGPVDTDEAARLRTELARLTQIKAVEL